MWILVKSFEKKSLNLINSSVRISARARINDKIIDRHPLTNRTAESVSIHSQSYFFYFRKFPWLVLHGHAETLQWSILRLDWRNQTPRLLWFIQGRYGTVGETFRMVRRSSSYCLRQKWICKSILLASRNHW